MRLEIDPNTKTWQTTGTWTKSGSYSGTIANSSYPIFVGLRARSYSYTCNLLVHEFSLKKNDIVTQQFISTVDSGHKPCFYESVSKTYFYSAGEGAFESGEDVS